MRRRWKPYGLSWHEWRGVEFREKISGARNVSEPKQLDEKERQRREWRERKGFSRSARKRCGCSSWKTWAKRESNRSHRAWERAQLHSGEWDDMIGDITKWTHDPWMWD